MPWRDPVRTEAFTYLVRSVTTSLIALSIVASSIVAQIMGLETRTIDEWAGLVVGVYIGNYFGQNGRSLREAVRTRDTLYVDHAVEAPPERRGK